MINPSHNEETILVFSTHWIKYLLPAFIYSLLMLVSFFLFFIAGATAYEQQGLAIFSFCFGSLLMVIVHHWFFHKLLSEAMIDIIVTTKRVIYLKNNLLFDDDMREFSMDRLIAVEAQKHGLWQNLFRYGNVRFDTGGSTSTDRSNIIHLVPHPHRITKEITKKLEMY